MSKRIQHMQRRRQDQRLKKTRISSAKRQKGGGSEKPVEDFRMHNDGLTRERGNASRNGVFVAKLKKTLKRADDLEDWV